MAMMNVDNGTTYRGIININHGTVKVTLAGGESYIKEQFEKQGFTDVNVWLDPGELPNNWPLDKRSDNSASGNTWAWIEATWLKPSGQIPSSNSDFYVVDRWPQKQTLQPVQPICFQYGVQCNNNNDCCSQYCINGQCGIQSNQYIPPIPVQSNCLQNGIQCNNNSDCCSQYCNNGQCGNQPIINVYNPTCVTEGMSCENINCCENQSLLCQQDTDGYWGGGKRCMIQEKSTDVELVNELQQQSKTKSSSLWYILGSVLVGGVITAVGVKMLSK